MSREYEVWGVRTVDDRSNVAVEHVRDSDQAAAIAEFYATSWTGSNTLVNIGVVRRTVVIGDWELQDEVLGDSSTRGTDELAAKDHG